MYVKGGPMTQEKLSEMRDVIRTLTSKVKKSIGSTADLMMEVMTTVDYEPFRLENHLIEEYPLPLPDFSSSSSSSSNRVVDSIFGPFDSTKNVELCDGVEECKSEGRGRYLVASRDLIPGEILIEENAFVNIINDTYSKVLCDSCFAYPEPDQEFQLCAACKSVAWCSQRCREKSLKEFHRFECSSKRQMATLKTDHYYLAMRMVVRGWQNLLYKFLTGSSMGEESGYADEFNLLENKDKVSFEKTIEAAVICKVFLWILKSTGFVERLREQVVERQRQRRNLSGGEPEAMSRMIDQFVASTLMSHWIRIQCNAFQHNFQRVIRKHRSPFHNVAEPMYEPIAPLGFGVLLSMKIAQINHSCRPNCDYYFIGTAQVIRTIDYIKKGEEIFITYERIARLMNEREDRSNHVAKTYGFACFCDYCNPPGKDLCELYAIEDTVAAETKKTIRGQMEEASELTYQNKVENALKILFALKKTCVDKSMFWSASDIDERIDECFGLLGTLIVLGQ